MLFEPTKGYKKSKKTRMNNLRKLRSKKTNVPNLKAKLWALRLMWNVLPVLGSPHSDASKQSSTNPGRTCSTLSINGNNDNPVLGCTNSTLSAMINRDDSEEEKKIKLHSAAQVLH